MPKYPSLPNPDGWFAVAFSDELRVGELQARKLFDTDVVLFRTESGKPAMLDAHCPHLGAHLGHGGVVDGEGVRCPFHGFRFDAEGTCISTPYETKIPPKCKAKAWELREQNGVILAWYHHAGAAPDWEVPVYDLEGWMPLDTHMWTLSTHPQETSENSVDLGHFGEVHKYYDVEADTTPVIDGPHLSMRYAMSRKGFALSRNSVTRTQFEAHVHGLGFSHVIIHEQTRNIHGRFWVLCTPTRDDLCELRVACSTKIHPDPKSVNIALGLMPRLMATKLIQKFAFSEFCSDVAQDFDVWQHKTYIEPPILAKGDGPVGRYRKWCRQFYTRLPIAVAS